VAADGATVELAETAPPVLDGQPTAPATGRLSGAAGSRVAQPTPVEPAVPVAVAPPREEARLDEGQIRAALALPADLEPLDVPRSAAPVQPAPRVAAATPRVAAPAPTAATALPAAAPPAAAPAPSAPAAATSRPASSASMGTLNVTSDPPSVVYIDGQLRGYTPLSGVSLPPGRHRVLLVNPERPIRRTIWVDIEAGQVLTRAANLHHD
jgi:hypothetical protein